MHLSRQPWWYASLGTLSASSACFIPSFLFPPSSTFISSLHKTTPFLHLPRIDIELPSRYPSFCFFFSPLILDLSTLRLSPPSIYPNNFFIDFNDLLYFFSLIYSSFLLAFSSFQLSFTCFFFLLRRSCFPFPGSIMALKRNERPLGFNLLTGKEEREREKNIIRILPRRRTEAVWLDQLRDCLVYDNYPD